MRKRPLHHIALFLAPPPTSLVFASHHFVRGVSPLAGDAAHALPSNASLLPVDAARSHNLRVVSPCPHAGDVDLAQVQARPKGIAGVDARIQPMQ